MVSTSKIAIFFSFFIVFRIPTGENEKLHLQNKFGLLIKSAEFSARYALHTLLKYDSLQDSVNILNGSIMDKEQIATVFRRWGYLQAKLDSFGRLDPFAYPELDKMSGAEAAKWRALYCGPIGVEFMHMLSPERCLWIQERMESSPESVNQQFLFKRLLQCEVFERFLHSRYVGVTRFSSEGSASLIPLLDSILQQAGTLGFETVIIGMSHRARLAVMTYIVGTPTANIIACFEDVDPKSALGSGDVKYHKGATGLYQTPAGNSLKIHLSSNPSHLEAIDPVILGRVRAKQTRINDEGYGKVLAILLHGDAAFAGQGITAETLNFSALNGFSIGGTIHIIVNNLIGFTENPSAFQSSRYSTDVAKRLSVPIFHVNGEEPESVWRVGKMAIDYRAAFQADAVIDLVGFRRHGHNEGDDPSITQPVLYSKIAKVPPLYRLYGERIGIKEDEIKKIEEETTEYLNVERERGRTMTEQPVFATFPDYWKPYHGGFHTEVEEVETAVPAERLLEIAERLNTFPSNFSVHPKVKKVYEQRLEMAKGSKPIDWGMAEALSVGSLLWDGHPVRMTGQDTRRGTFSHRHAALIDSKNASEYLPLTNLHPKQGWFQIYDSMLSEAAAVGFEYGFSRDFPEALVCWEAQFGDFVNGAQVIIDQFIAAAEDKWGLLSGLVLLLPHGYEGRGPEHSSARIERFLQLAGEDNIQVCYPSTASQYFHLLRRQVLRKWRKPLIVFTPKSLLRAPSASSPLEEFTGGMFHPVLHAEDKPEATRLLLCSGKIAHELFSEQLARKDETTAIIRIEQLYPFPEPELSQALTFYPQATQMVWVQEEPSNMGALNYIRPRLMELAGNRKLSTVKRTESASPATGSGKAHAMEQERIVKLAFAKYS